MRTTLNGEPNLTDILQRYNDVTEKLKRSHEALGREVCRLREELHQKNKELQRRERLAALGGIAAGVAHEIRNPLGGIRIYASLLERDLADRPEQLEIVRRLETGVSNMERIVSDILSFAGDSEPDRQGVRFERILDSALAQTAPRIEADSVDLDVDPSLAAVELYCDEGQIGRALINLILNAVDASGRDGRVWIRKGDLGATVGDRAGGLCPIHIDDNGPGMDPSLIQRVFNPFFTTKHTGTGLGLAIVHRIAEANGGYVTACNRPSGGARFVLSVPLARTRPQSN